MTVFAHLDEPVNGIATAPVAVVRGWIAAPGPGPIAPVALVNGSDAVPLFAVERPDVRRANPALVSSGFSGWMDARLAERGPWRVRYDLRGTPGETKIGLRAAPEAGRRFGAAKARKLARMRNILRCPWCLVELADGDDSLRCPAGHVFPVSRNAYSMLDDAAAELIRAHTGDTVSGHGYDETLLALIASSAGPILDVGAGLRPDYREDVINLELVAYPTTDVVAASDHLPFADDAFDLVISVAVLEHVRDPFRAAAELQRVLRPGGRVFAAVPFLQPYHGYPQHYYNMTAAGLRNLFADVDVERIEVPASGHPIFALSWIVRSWHDALPEQAAAAFQKLTVADLTQDASKFLELPFVRELPPAARERLAALNVLVGRKRVT